MVPMGHFTENFTKRHKESAQGDLESKWPNFSQAL